MRNRRKRRGPRSEEILDPTPNDPLSNEVTAKQPTPVDPGPAQQPPQVPAVATPSALAPAMNKDLVSSPPPTAEPVPAAPRGRRPVFDGLTKQQLLDLVQHGISVPQATAAVGCSVRTFYRWLADDPNFKREYHDRRCHSQYDPLELIRRHAGENWRAAAYLHQQAKRNARKGKKLWSEPPDEMIAKIEAPLQTFIDEMIELVKEQTEGEVQETLRQCLQRNVDALELVMKALWHPRESQLRHDLF